MLMKVTVYSEGICFPTAQPTTEMPSEVPSEEPTQEPSVTLSESPTEEEEVTDTATKSHLSRLMQGVTVGMASAFVVMFK